jgi:hypothetical protein
MKDLPGQPLVRNTEHPEVPYTPLSDPHTEFRLLSLKPRQHQISPAIEDVQVYCDLETVAFVKDLSYIALSYSWGTSKERRSVMIGDQLCNISSNLEEALREIRHEDVAVLLWCDQLCINQHDDVEKSIQVQRMKDIYRDASKVIAWLGPEADDSALCIARLRSLGQNGLKENLEGIMDVLKDYKHPHELTRLKIAYDHFCQRPYWQRLWILQEFALGKDVQLLCGPSTISYEELLSALFWYSGAELSAEQRALCAEVILCFSSDAVTFVQSVFTCRERYRKRDNYKEMILFRIMVTCLTLEYDNNHPQCSDPRDRVFSMMSLAHDAKDFDKFPDYTKSCEDIYEEAARQFLRQGHIEVLAYCQFPRAIREREMATWAPDWYMPTKAPSTNVPWITDFNSTGDTADQQDVQFPDLQRVSLLGICIDAVDYYGSLWDPDWLQPLEPSDTMKYLNEILYLLNQSERYTKTDDSLAQVQNLARIAVADRLYSTEEGSHEEKEQLCFEALRILCESCDYATLQPPLDPEQQKLKREQIMDLNYAHLVIRMQARRPFISKTGYVGLAPHHVEDGDEICTFLGSNVAYIIRPIGDGEYNLVGETYVHGVMYGELMENDPPVRRYVLR